jgi:hypothetical protein
MWARASPHEAEADGAGDQKRDPGDHEVREEELRCDGEAAGQEASISRSL